MIGGDGGGDRVVSVGWQQEGTQNWRGMVHTTLVFEVSLCTYNLLVAKWLPFWEGMM